MPPATGVAVKDSMRAAVGLPITSPHKSQAFVCVLRMLAGIVAISLLTLSKVAALEALPPSAAYEIPNDLSGVHFYLITVDVGDMVYDNFGHTALRVYDENTDTDTVFNWGVFDLSGGVVNFSYDFFKGIMRYQLDTHTPAQEFASYRYQERTVWQDRINLTNPQKAMLLRRLLWNMQPENIVYDYLYFTDNCTTRVRDYLNEALGGKVAAYNNDITASTYRDLVQAHYASVALIGFSLDILMNSNIDRPITEWEEMFLPLSLRTRLSQIPSDVAEQGRRLPLLSDAQVIMEFPPPHVATNPYQVASVVLLAPIFLLLLMLKKIPMSYFATHSRLSLKAPDLNFRLLGILGLCTALFSGVYGTLMLGSWFISDHLDLHHNLNLLLFWPTDLLGLIVALYWFFACKPWPMTHNSKPFINYYLFAHLVGMLIYGVMVGFDLNQQSILNIALYVLPGFFLYTVLIWLVGFEPAKPRNMFF